MTKAALKFLLAVLAVFAAIVGVLRAFFVTPVVITDDGMAPTLLAGETVLMWNSTDTPDFADVVVCRHPTGSGYVVGRFMGRPGSTLSAERGTLRIDGQAADSNILRTVAFTMHGETQARQVVVANESIGGIEHLYMQDARVGYRNRDIRVRDGIFLMGDNRLPHTFDSRTFGPVNPSTCVGHVFMRFKTAPNRVEFDNAVLDVID